MPPDAAQKGYKQLVRYIPRKDNSGAANTEWASFCRKYDGGAGNGQFVAKKEEQPKVNKDLVSLGASNTISRHGTVTHRYSARYTRAVFSMVFDNAAKGAQEKNHWLLKENPCWASQIVPRDPGFALMTDDQYYAAAQPASWRVRVSGGLYKSKDIPEDIKQSSREYWRNHSKKRDISALFEDELEEPQFSERTLELIDDGGSLAIREANSSRRLSEEEMKRDVQIIPCESKDCWEELAARKNLDDAALVTRGESPPTEPRANAEAVPTPQASTIVTKVDKRSAASPEIPEMTTAPAQ